MNNPGDRFTLMTIAALVFASLWLHERWKGPKEVVREVPRTVEVIKTVPMERIREVTREVTKEVPVEMTEEQLTALNVGSNYLCAPYLPSMEASLYDLESVNVKVNLNPALEEVIGAELVKTAFNTVLKTGNIQVDEQSPYLLGINCSGAWDAEQTNLTYALHVELYDSVTLERKGELRRTDAIVWVRDTMDTTTKENARENILSRLATIGRLFAANFIAGVKPGQ